MREKYTKFRRLCRNNIEMCGENFLSVSTWIWNVPVSWFANRFIYITIFAKLFRILFFHWQINIENDLIRLLSYYLFFFIFHNSLSSSSFCSSLFFFLKIAFYFLLLKQLRPKKILTCMLSILHILNSFPLNSSWQSYKLVLKQRVRHCLAKTFKNMHRKIWKIEEKLQIHCPISCNTKSL